MNDAESTLLVREPDAGKLPVRFDEREVETEHGRRLMRHRRGNPDTEVSRSLTHRATSRLYYGLMVFQRCGRRGAFRVGRRGLATLNFGLVAICHETQLLAGEIKGRPLRGWDSR
jgi:hypothetical protein